MNKLIITVFYDNTITKYRVTSWEIAPSEIAVVYPRQEVDLSTVPVDFFTNFINYHHYQDNVYPMSELDSDINTLSRSIDNDNYPMSMKRINTFGIFESL